MKIAAAVTALAVSFAVATPAAGKRADKDAWCKAMGEKLDKLDAACAPLVQDLVKKGWRQDSPELATETNNCELKNKTVYCCSLQPAGCRSNPKKPEKGWWYSAAALRDWEVLLCQESALDSPEECRKALMKQ